MHNSLFNTTQETATRLTLCLPLLSRPSTIDEIAAIDLTATYMKAFGFGQHNLHGDGPHALAEYDARRKRVQAGLAQLVIIGAATVIPLACSTAPLRNVFNIQKHCMAIMLPPIAGLFSCWRRKIMKTS